MGTIIAQAPAPTPAGPAQQPPRARVVVRVVNVGQNAAGVEIPGVTNGAELLYAIARSFRGLPGYADSKAVAERLDCRVVTRETVPADEPNAIAAFFKGPTRAIQKTDKFPDLELGLVPGCWIWAKVRPATVLGAVGEAVEEAIVDLVGYFEPVVSFFAAGPDKDERYSKSE